MLFTILPYYIRSQMLPLAVVVGYPAHDAGWPTILIWELFQGIGLSVLKPGTPGRLVTLPADQDLSHVRYSMHLPSIHLCIDIFVL